MKNLVKDIHQRRLNEDLEGFAPALPLPCNENLN